MEIIAVLVIMALVFGVCFLVDKGFTKLFRSQAQHMSGKAVRLNKKYGAIGLILGALGIAAIFSGLSGNWIMIIGGSLVLIVGIGLVVYYMTYAIFYDDDSFLVTTIGKRATVYRYGDIQNQQLYNNQGHALIELYLSDGRTVQIQGSMEGAYAFMEYAFSAWLIQTGRTREDCAFYDPQNSCWFPPVEA